MSEITERFFFSSIFWRANVDTLFFSPLGCGFDTIFFAWGSIALPEFHFAHLGLHFTWAMINHPLAWSWCWVSVSVEKPDTANYQQNKDEHRDHRASYRGSISPFLGLSVWTIGSARLNFAALISPFLSQPIDAIGTSSNFLTPLAVEVVILTQTGVAVFGDITGF